MYVQVFAIQRSTTLEFDKKSVTIANLQDCEGTSRRRMCVHNHMVFDNTTFSRHSCNTALQNDDEYMLR